MKPYTIDSRRQLVIPGDSTQTIAYGAEQFIACANAAIAQRGRFVVALSGGTTPNGIYGLLARPENRARVDWSNVWMFWSDERAVPPTDPESNYHAAMAAGLDKLPVPKDQIFRMEAEGDTIAGAQRYNDCLNKHLPDDQPFDLMMLGMGDDGHVASLFPGTKALDVHRCRAVANEVPQKKCWRMSLTFDEINRARQIVCYVMGSGKAQRLAQVLQPGPKAADQLLPADRVGTAEHPCLWVVDRSAAEQWIPTP